MKCEGFGRRKLTGRAMGERGHIYIYIYMYIYI